MNLSQNPDHRDARSLYNTDVIESHINLFVYQYLGRSTDADNVIVGKHGDLFLGNRHNRLMYKTMGLYPYSEQQLENWGASLLSLQQKVEQQGSHFLISLAPNKHSIYPENLPHWAKPAVPNLTDKLLAKARQLEIKIADPRAALLDAKSSPSARVYWRSDSHWNQLGGAVGFVETIKALNVYHQSAIHWREFHHSFKPTGAFGGHARFLKIQQLLPDDFETHVSTVVQGEREVCYGRINDETLAMEPCQMHKRPYVDIHQGPQYAINNAAANNVKVLLLCDSFVMQNSGLYHQTFQTVWKHKYNHLKGERLNQFIQMHQPDLVIYQVVERSLFNNEFIDINHKN